MYFVSARRQPLPATVAFDRLFDNAFDRLFAAPAGSDTLPARQPSLDVSEDDGRFVVVLDVPGVRREDIEVSVEGRRLSIVAKVREQDDTAPVPSDSTQASSAPTTEAAAPAKKVRALLRERSSARFARSLTLPVEVDQAGAQARLENGVLTLTLPKRAAAVSRLTIN